MFVSSLGYTSQQKRILVAHNSIIAANVRKKSVKMQKLSSKSPRWESKKLMDNWVDINLSLGWEFHLSQDRRGKCTQVDFFFSFLVVNTIRALTTDWIEFTPGRWFRSKQAPRYDLAYVTKFSYMLHHGAVPIKLYILTVSL